MNGGRIPGRRDPAFLPKLAPEDVEQSPGGTGRPFLEQHAPVHVSEAYGGYHFDVLNGINFDAGIFMSYVGLFSYYQFDNWAYQPSYVSSNTPWFFNGVRIQLAGSGVHAGSPHLGEPDYGRSAGQNVTVIRFVPQEILLKWRRRRREERLLRGRRATTRRPTCARERCAARRRGR
jgi:hypothetical protein